MPEKKHALSVLNGLKIAPGANLNAAGKALNEQLRLIRNADTEFAMRAVFVGASLLMVKESLEHGQFGPWLDKHIDDLGRRQVNYYMRLALAALDAQRVEQKALAAITVGDIDSALTVSKGAAGEFRAAVEKFVGASSLAELLAEHCGKKAGGKKKTGGTSDENVTEVETAAETEKSAQDLCAEIEEHLALARKAAVDPAVWMRLSKKQQDELRDSFEAAHARVAEIHAKTHGKKK